MSGSETNEDEESRSWGRLLDRDRSCHEIRSAHYREDEGI